jgi:hypothetical protein
MIIFLLIVHLVFTRKRRTKVRTEFDFQSQSEKGWHLQNAGPSSNDIPLLAKSGKFCKY